MRRAPKFAVLVDLTKELPFYQNRFGERLVLQARPDKQTGMEFRRL